MFYIFSELHAVTFAVTCGFTGLTMLTLGVNSITAALGAFNLALYTMAYTPMKRITSANTWLGSIVGAVPPMMGWAASTGGLEAGGLVIVRYLILLIGGDLHRMRRLWERGNVTCVYNWFKNFRV